MVTKACSTRQEWLAGPERKRALRFLPTYCPHLDPIERFGGGDASEHHPQSGLQDVP